MLNARYSGVDENNQLFNVAADLATQSPEDENLVELQNPKADIRTTEGDLVALSARLGYYHQDEERLDLAGTVHLSTEEQTSAHKSPMRNSYAVLRLQQDHTT